MSGLYLLFLFRIFFLFYFTPVNMRNVLKIDICYQVEESILCTGRMDVLIVRFSVIRLWFKAIYSLILQSSIITLKHLILAVFILI